MRPSLKALAFILGLLPSLALAQSQVPLGFHTVWGRLGAAPGDTGPGQAIPFATLQKSFAKSGNGPTLATSNGALTPGDCVRIDPDFNFVDSGSTSCGTGTSTPHTQDFLATTNFTPGTTTSLTLSSAPSTSDLLIIAFDGVWQNANTWSLSGAVVTFSAAIPLNIQVVEAKWSTSSTLAGVGSIGQSGTPLTGAVTVSSGAGMIAQSGQNIAFSPGNYNTTLTNGVARTVLDKQQDLNSVFDFGVKCDNSTDDATTLQNAINATPVGGKLYIPFKNAGVCRTSATLAFTNPIHLVCDPGVAIKPVPAINSIAALDFIGSPNGLAFPTIVENCFIGDPAVNTRRGGVGMLFDTQTAGNYFRGLELRNVTIKAGTTGAYGALFVNNVTNNPNGGIFASAIRGGTIEGGIEFSGSGDNLSIRDTLIPWNGTSGADNNGILVNLVSGAGSFLIDHINFSQPGGLVFDSVYSGVVQNSQFEGRAVSTESNGAIVDVRAGTATILDFKFRNNQVQAIGGVGTPTLLHISSNATHVVVDGNAFATPTFYTGVFNSSAGLQLGPNYWNSGAHLSGTAPANTYGGG